MKKLALILLTSGLLVACGSSSTRTVTQPGVSQQDQSYQEQDQQSGACIITDSDGKLCGQDAVAWCNMALQNNAQLSYQGYNTGQSNVDTSGACVKVYDSTH